MAAVVSDSTKLQELFKIRYRETGEENYILGHRHVLYGKMMREKDMTGLTFTWPVKYSEAHGHARGADGLTDLLTSSASSIHPSAYKAWMLGLEVEYAAAFFDNVTKLKMSNDKGSYKRLVETEISSVLRNFSYSMGHAVYRDGQGIIGTVGSITAFSSQIATITLTRRSDAKFFSVNQLLNSVDHTSPAAPRGGDYATSTLRVLAVDKVKGIVRVIREGSNAVESTVAGNYLSPWHWYSQNGVGRVKGLAAICPSVAPASGDPLFYGVDRSVDPQTLAGWRFDDATANPELVPLEDQIREMVTYMSANSMDSDEMWVLVNPVQLEKTLQNAAGKLQYEREDRGTGEYVYGYNYVTVRTTEGDVKVYADPDCPEERWYGMGNKNLRLGTLGEEPEIIVSDRIREGKDGTEFRARLLAQVLPDCPRGICTGPLA